MSENPPIQWQPISRLPLLAMMVKGMLKDNQSQYALFLEAREKPWVLDNATVDRALRVYRVQREDLKLYDEQFARWQQESLTVDQQAAVSELITLLAQLKTVVDQILALLDELKDGTIEKMLGKSDLEVGLEVLLGLSSAPRPRRRRRRKQR